MCTRRSSGHASRRDGGSTPRYVRLPTQNETFVSVRVTSSTRDVLPVARIDDRELSPCPGSLTAAAQVAFASLVSETTDP